MRRFIAIPLVTMLALAPGCGGEEEQEVVFTRPVTLERVLSMDLTDHIEATGQLIPENRAEIAAEVSGRITEIRIDEGQHATAGSVILFIDPERRELDRNRARAQFEEARAGQREQIREHKRFQDLFSRNVASQSQLDAALTQLELARSRVAAAKADLGTAERAVADANVAAPFAGHIAERFVSVGEYVQQGQKLVELVALDPIQVEFHVSEADSGLVEFGQRVDVTVAPYPDEVFDAIVSVISPKIDARSRTLKVKGRIDNSDARLRPGLFARVDLGLMTREGVTMIPEEAVLQRADGAVVFLSNGDSRVKRIVVETGVHRGGQVEILRGVAQGDLVVTRGHSKLTDGDVVDPRSPTGERLSESVPSVATQ